jgi:hypothetical protein
MNEYLQPKNTNKYEYERIRIRITPLIHIPVLQYIVIQLSTVSALILILNCALCLSVGNWNHNLRKLKRSWVLAEKSIGRISTCQNVQLRVAERC